MRNSPSTSASLRIGWVVAGVAIIAGLLVLVVSLVDPGLDRPAVTTVVATVTLLFAGILIGRLSSGETVAEAGIAGATILLLLVGYLELGRGVEVPGIVWVAGPFYAAAFAMVAAWTGEMLQGTVEDAHDDRRLDWPWVFVSVVCGLVLLVYGYFLGEALMGLTSVHLLAVMLLSVFVTGWMVGFFSPGFTAVEPALASAMIVVFSAGLAEVVLAQPLPLSTLLIGGVGGMTLGLAGGWLGELTQSGPRGAAVRRLIRGV